MYENGTNGNSYETYHLDPNAAAGTNSAPVQNGTPVAGAAASNGMTGQGSPVQNGMPVAAPARKSGVFQKILLSISLGLLFGIFGGVGFFAAYQGMKTMQKEQPAQVEEKEEKESTRKKVVEEPKDAEDEGMVIQKANTHVQYVNGSSNVSLIVEEVMPAMVSIVNHYTDKGVFWGQTYEEEMEASGSGIIVSQNDSELLIVTNNHVVENAEKLQVTMIDGSEVEAKIKGVDSEMDLAVIAIPLKDIKQKTRDAIAIATLGDSDDLVLGEQVIAIGNALGYGQSVTVGYISALDREIQLEDGDHRKFIQTDAAINPGNSGGALLNSAGEVIGINSNKIGGSAVEGMGYAIPITAASPIIADLMERQTRYKVSDAERGYIGITKQDITDEIALMYGMPRGVYVLSVLEGTAAEKAGIIKGDVIVKFDGNKINGDEDLMNTLQYCAVGDTVKITVMRPERGEYVEHEMELTLGERPKEKRN